MSKAIIVATGDLDHLPREVQTIANELSANGWIVRLCISGDASRAGLMAAAGEGDVDLAWFGLHSGPDGFALSDGVWPPAQLGTWLRNVNACDVVLNSCYSIEHVDAIQRAAAIWVIVAVCRSAACLAWLVMPQVNCACGVFTALNTATPGTIAVQAASRCSAMMSKCSISALTFM